jgi:hypothetical protein
LPTFSPIFNLFLQDFLQGKTTSPQTKKTLSGLTLLEVNHSPDGDVLGQTNPNNAW